jgi:hypothetical protein
MIRKSIIFSAIFFTTYLAHSSEVSYEVMDRFHKSRIDSIVKEYDLEKRAKITYSLLPGDEFKKSETAIIKLPGLLLDAISLNSVKKEVGLVEIMDALKNYKRKIVILKSSRINTQEIDVLKQALSDDIFLADVGEILVKPWSVEKIWYNDLKTSFKNNILTSPYAYLGLIVFLVISFLIFGLSSAILDGFKTVGKSIYDSVEQSMGGSGANGMSAVKNDEAAPLGGADGVSQFEVVDSDFGGGFDSQEVDFHSLLSLIVKTATQKPCEFKMKMWEIFPNVNDQLSLYIAFETELQTENMEVFSQMFNSIFKMGSSESSKLPNKDSSSGGVQSSLWHLRLSLTYMMVMPVDSKREGALDLILKNFQGQLDAIIAGSLSEHFKVMSYLFPKKVANSLNNLDEIDEKFTDQIIKFASTEQELRSPSDLDFKNFEKHLIENNYFLQDFSKEEKARDFDLLSRLSDHILFGNKEFSGEILNEFNKKVPNLNWIDLDKEDVHKNFIMSLAPDEAAHFVQHYDQIDLFREKLNTRTSSRLQDLILKSQNPNSVVSVKGLRTKIGMFYTYKVEEESNGLQSAA